MTARQDAIRDLLDEVKLTQRTLPLDHATVAAQLSQALEYRLPVMVRRWPDDRPRHNRLYRDGAAGPWYVRTGKRATLRQYLTACEVSYFDGEPTLFVYSLSTERPTP